MIYIPWADLLSDHFDSKQSREAVDLPRLLGIHLLVLIATFAFRSSEVRRLLLDVDPYGALTHWVCMFPLFLKRTADPVYTQFLSNRSRQVTVDGCRGKLVNVVSGVPQGSVLCLLLFLLYTSELFSILENKLIG